jgi:hypothetical protein
VVAAVLVVAGAIYVLAPKHHDTPSAEAWDGDAGQAFSDLVGRVPTLVSSARDWLAHTKTDEAFREEVERDFTAFERSRQRVQRLKTPKEFVDAHRLYEASATLYVETAEVYRSAVGVADATQFDLLARRLRELGDRVFDRGRTDLGVVEASGPDVQVNAPEEVPIWSAEGLAAGPPLDDPPPPAAPSPPLRADTRAQQSRSAWERDVARAKAPRPTALRTRDERKLRDAARRFIAAAEYLRGRPDPRGGREESARLRLSWLVYADAARAAQLRLTHVSGQLQRAAAMIAP